LFYRVEREVKKEARFRKRLSDGISRRSSLAP